MSAEIVEYDRGYLSSKVQTRYVLQDPELVAQFEADELPTEFIVNSAVSHGLFSLSAHSSIEDLAFPLTVDTVTQLNGNTSYTVNLDHWYYQTQTGEELAISISPSSIEGDVSVLGQLTYKLHIPSVELDFSTGEKMVFSKIDAQGEGKQENGFWLGNQTLSIGLFAISDLSTSQAVFKIEQGQYEFNSDLNKEQTRLNSNHKVSMATILTPDGMVENFTMDFTMGDIDSAAFESLMSMYQNNPIMTESEVLEAIPYVESLFSKGFYLAMNKLSLQIGQGEFESQWKLSVPEGTDGISQDPTIILPALTGELNTYFSNQLVIDYPFIKQGIDEAMIMEIIEQTDDGYRIKAELKNANIVLASGQEIPLMALLMPLLLQ